MTHYFATNTDKFNKYYSRLSGAIFYHELPELRITVMKLHGDRYLNYVKQFATLLSTTTKTDKADYLMDGKYIHISQLKQVLVNDDVQAIRKMSRWLINKNRHIKRSELSKEMCEEITLIEDSCRESL